MNESSTHVLVKYSDKFGDTIALHNKVVESFGYVWFGKIGTPISKVRLSKLRSQIEIGQTTWLYIVRREKKTVVHKAQLLDVTRDRPGEEGIPHYYRDHNLLNFMRCWFKVRAFSPCRMSEFNRLTVASSLSKVSESLVSSTSGFFIVKIK